MPAHTEQTPGEQPEPEPEPERGTYELRSPYRPLPREALRRLHDDFDVVEELESDGGGRNGGVIVRQLPPEPFRDRYELIVVDEPVVVYSTERGKRVEIYTNPDKVVADGGELGLSPSDAVQRAEQMDDWTVIEGDPDAVYLSPQLSES